MNIDTKSRFNALTDAEQNHIMNFLFSQITKEYVKIVSDEERGMIKFFDYHDFEYKQIDDKSGFIKRDTLIKRLTIVDYDNFTYLVDASQDPIFPTIRTNDATVFTVRFDDVADKSQVYFHYTHAFFNKGKEQETLANVCSRLSNGKAKVITREDKIKERHEHDVRHGSTATLEQYQEATSHDNLRDLYIETEEGVSEEELNYNNFSTPLWKMTNANTKYYRNSASL